MRENEISLFVGKYRFIEYNRNDMVKKCEAQKIREKTKEYQQSLSCNALAVTLQKMFPF